MTVWPEKVYYPGPAEASEIMELGDELKPLLEHAQMLRDMARELREPHAPPEPIRPATDGHEVAVGITYDALWQVQSALSMAASQIEYAAATVPRALVEMRPHDPPRAAAPARPRGLLQRARRGEPRE